jgi:hypothetical protein
MLRFTSYILKDFTRQVGPGLLQKLTLYIGDALNHCLGGKEDMHLFIY